MILLMNMLIAMMAKTFDKVFEEQVTNYNYLAARVVLAVDSQMGNIPSPVSLLRTRGRRRGCSTASAAPQGVPARHVAQRGDRAGPLGTWPVTWTSTRSASQIRHGRAEALRLRRRSQTDDLKERIRYTHVSARERLDNLLGSTGRTSSPISTPSSARSAPASSRSAPTGVAGVAAQVRSTDGAAARRSRCRRTPG